MEANLEPDHLARVIRRALLRLDFQQLLGPLFELYAGFGSPAYPPLLLLAAVLFEVHRGHHSPATWYRDAKESLPMRWLLRGFTPSRACWYAFRDRLGPKVLALGQQVIAQALAEGFTKAERAAIDGTLVAANASRHRLLNEETLTRRCQQLLAALADDAAPRTKADGNANVTAEDRNDSAVAAVAVPTTALANGIAPREDTTAAPAVAALAEAVANSAAAPTVAALANEIASGEDTAAAPAVAALAEALGNAPTLSAAETPPSVLPRPRWMATTPQGRQHQAARYQQAQEIMAARQERNRRKRASKRTPSERLVVSVSDPEAPISRDKEKVFRPLYNTQVLQDLDSPLVLGWLVAAQPNDTGLLGPVLRQFHSGVGVTIRKVLGDATYAGGADVAEAESLGTTVYAPWQSNDVPKPRPGSAKSPVGDSASQRPRYYAKEEFRWQASEGVYVCPQGQRLTFQGKSEQQRSGPERITLAMYRGEVSTCQACPVRSSCTGGQGARTISRSEHEEVLESLRARMGSEASQELYRRRKETVERTNADTKEHRKLRRVSGRGLGRASADIGLTFLASNLVVLDSMRRQRAAEKEKSATTCSPPDP